MINSTKLEETKELQKLRQRPHGVSVAALALGKNVPEEEGTTVWQNDDLFHIPWSFN